MRVSFLLSDLTTILNKCFQTGRENDINSNKKREKAM